MCMSVPQMAARLTRIMTSFGPGAGLGMSWRSMPVAARALTSACIRRGILDYVQFFADLREGCDGALELLTRVRSGHLRADPGFALWHDWIREADHVNAFVQQAARELGGELRVAEHDRDDRVLAGHEVEAGRGHAFTEMRGVFPQASAQGRVRFEHVEHAQGCRGDERRDAVGEQVWPRALPQPRDDFLAARGVAAA